MMEINQWWDEIIMPTDEEPLHENHEEDGCIQNFDALIVDLMESDAVTSCEESVTTREPGMLDDELQMSL
ncbi:hypothetical protein D5086_005762 [Populus alba]|uniref:Uncharacterized protein n=1 Tax=Populus alba TaxID=43335 RepID=A0ACC4CUC0_POPAL